MRIRGPVVVVTREVVATAEMRGSREIASIGPNLFIGKRWFGGIKGRVVIRMREWRLVFVIWV